MTNKKKTTCALCGRRIEGDMCVHCGFNQREAHILEQTGILKMRCPYIADVARWEQCQGEIFIRAEHLRGRVIAEDGPYAIKHYPYLNHRCRICGRYVFGVGLILGNLDRLREQE
jgi:hypothetical protein